MVDAGPADGHEDQAGTQERGNGHAGDRVRRRPDLAGDAGGHGGEEEPEQHDQDRAEQVDPYLREQGEHDSEGDRPAHGEGDRKSTRLNSSHDQISYAVFCLTKKRQEYTPRWIYVLT